MADLRIVSNEANTLALFCKDDSAIGFYCRTTRPDRLATEVFKAMFCTDYDREHADEVNRIVAQLLGEGHAGFEDGWLELRTGVDDIVSFFMTKLAEAKDEERYADGQRYAELQKRKTAEEWYGNLCTALTRALGPAGAAEVRGKIAYATAGGA